MFEISFLGAAKPLTKTITPTTKTAYPMVKNFTSDSKAIDTIEQFYEHMCTAAATGKCLLKGALKQPLVNESRAGKTANSQTTNWICIDIDGMDAADIKIPAQDIDSTALAKLAERVIRRLPEELQEIDFIVQASSSLGLKSKEISMHLFFLLDNPITPQTLKKYLTNVNFLLPELHDSLQLTKLGWDVKYTLDRCLAENSRLIYITPPVFEDMKSPFKTDADRIVLVKKLDNHVSVEKLLDVSMQDVTDIKNKKIKTLRKELGMPAGKPKYTSLTVNGQKLNVLRNPTPGSLLKSYKARGFTYYNKDGGTSNSYYHSDTSPKIIYNFKGEPAFRWEDADPEGYQEYVEEFGDAIKQANPEENFAIIDRLNDGIYKITANENTRELLIVKSTEVNVGHFYREIGDIMPETVPRWTIGFDRTSHTMIDHGEKTINTYVPSMVILEAEKYDGKVSINSIKKECPIIHQIMQHMLGGGAEEYEWFANWLANIIQAKTKPKTAWFLSGVQGTGKGIFYSKVIDAVLGYQNTAYHLTGIMKDKFNDWKVNKQLVVIDEFQLPKGKAGIEMIEIVKNWITEEKTSIRAMHRAAVNVPSIEGYMFFSNVHAMIKIETSDRRFNIAPRQEVPIDRMPFFDRATVVETIENELQAFANIMVNVPINMSMVNTSLNNTAKKVAAAASRSIGESFITALHEKDIMHFYNLLLTDPSDAGSDLELQAAIVMGRTVIKRWLKQVPVTRVKDYTIDATLGEITEVFRLASMDPRMKTVHIKQMLQKQGLIASATIQRRHEGVRKRMFQLTFSPNSEVTQDLIDSAVATPPHATVASITGGPL